MNRRKVFSLKNKVAIVTGGGKGIGASIAEIFCQQGAIVHILDIDAEAGSEVVQLITEQGGVAYFHACDVTDHGLVQKTFEKVVADSGHLDLLVNNAAIAHIGSVRTTTPEDIDRLYQVNIKSVYSCLHFGVLHMQKSGGGAIVNMASIASVVGLKDRFAYSMSKGAVYAMTFSIAKDYLKDNIRCNAIGPARVHTSFVDNFIANNYPGQEEQMFEKLSKSQPIGRMGLPKEIAWLAAYLCSDEAAFITGSFYPIDGGFLSLNS